MRLVEMNLLDLGNTIQVAGVVYGDGDKLYLCMLPDDPVNGRELIQLDLDQAEWEQVVRQTDIMETEVLAQAKDGKLAKVIIRKSTRLVEQGVSWNVYRRDAYQCRYCNKDDVPLTVDHLVLWEEGGPSIEANLVTACRRCNKTRGRMQYADWLKHPYYLKVSGALSPVQAARNVQLLETLAGIPRKYHVASR